MYVSKISPVVSGNFKIANKPQVQSKTSQSYASNSVLMDKNTVSALKAQVSFKGESPIGITEGVVEKVPSINVVLNGPDKIKDLLYYDNEKGTVVRSLKNDDKREIVITHKGKPVLEGFIKDDLGNDVKIEYKSAKHQPETKITMPDGTTVQLLEGSEIIDRNGLFRLQNPGNYTALKPAQKETRGIESLSSNVSFTGNYVSLLCKKDATVKATNDSKHVPFTVVGKEPVGIINDDPTFAVLAGGYGTRFQNMTGGEQNKPSFVMPNGQSILSSAFDLIKNATAAPDLGHVTYLGQNGGDNLPANPKLISAEDDIIQMKSYSSDGGAVMQAVIDGKIPNDKPLVILNADTITNVDISRVYDKLKNLDNAAMVIPRYAVSETRAKSFGLMSAGRVVDADDSKELVKFIEKPEDPKTMAQTAMINGKTVKGEQAYYGNPGIYLFNKEVLQNLPLILPVAEEIALVKEQEAVRKKNLKEGTNNPIPTELKDPYSASTFLGNAFVPAIVRLCQEGKLKNSQGEPMHTYMVSMQTADGKEAFWDDIGAAEAFVHVAQDIAYETKINGDGKNNMFYGVRGLSDFEDSVDTTRGIVYASPLDRERFEAKYANRFDIHGDAYITCKA